MHRFLCYIYPRQASGCPPHLGVWLLTPCEGKTQSAENDKPTQICDKITLTRQMSTQYYSWIEAKICMKFDNAQALSAACACQLTPQCTKAHIAPAAARQ